MTRDDWYEIHRPARRFDDDVYRRSGGRLAIVRDGVLTFVSVLVIVVGFLIAAGGTT